LLGATIPVRFRGVAGKRTVINYNITLIQKSLATAFGEKLRMGALRRAYSIQNIQP
jgi:hypothetical protein